MHKSTSKYDTNRFNGWNQAHVEQRILKKRIRYKFLMKPLISKRIDLVITIKNFIKLNVKKHIVFLTREFISKMEENILKSSLISVDSLLKLIKVNICA